MRRPKSEIRASDTLVDATLSAIADAGSTPAVSTNKAAPSGAADSLGDELEVGGVKGLCCRDVLVHIARPVGHDPPF